MIRNGNKKIKLSAYKGKVFLRFFSFSFHFIQLCNGEGCPLGCCPGIISQCGSQKKFGNILRTDPRPVHVIGCDQPGEVYSILESSTYQVTS